MTYRELIKSALPPAPEYPALRRLRFTAAALCLLSAIAIGTARAIDNTSPWFTLFSFVLGIFSFGLLVHLFRRKVRHDLDYWTPERVRLHRAFPDLVPPGGPAAS